MYIKDKLNMAMEMTTVFFEKTFVISTKDQVVLKTSGRNELVTSGF